MSDKKRYVIAYRISPTSCATLCHGATVDFPKGFFHWARLLTMDEAVLTMSGIVRSGDDTKGWKAEDIAEMHLGIYPVPDEATALFAQKTAIVKSCKNSKELAERGGEASNILREANRILDEALAAQVAQ